MFLPIDASSGATAKERQAAKNPDVNPGVPRLLGRETFEKGKHVYPMRHRDVPGRYPRSMVATGWL